MNLDDNAAPGSTPRRSRVEPQGDNARDADTDTVIWNLAARQRGVVARRQLLERGIPKHAVDYRVRRGRLVALYRGVYRVGPAVLPLAAEMAAVLACGGDGVLSHRTAAALWGLAPRATGQPVEIVTRRRSAPSGSHILVRRHVLTEAEVAKREGLPVTTPARTIIDLAGCLPTRDVERVLARAEREGLVESAELRRLLTGRRRRGSGALRRLLNSSGEPALLRSEAEAALLALVRRGRLPAPESNTRVRGYEVDFFWRTQRLVVEVDGFAYHASSRAFEEDRRRDAVLAGAGLRVVRITWRQLTREPEPTLVRLAQALAVG